MAMVNAENNCCKMVLALQLMILALLLLLLLLPSAGVNIFCPGVSVSSDVTRVSDTADLGGTGQGGGSEASASAECEPTSGVVDGALCDCEENDCLDGRDNDGDGLTDCDDPDCDCLEPECPECPPCDECQDTYPNCDGECPDGTECELDRQRQMCVCNEAESCEDSEYPRCGGYCPDGQECLGMMGETAVAAIGTCECVDTEELCEESDYPMCGGACPPRYHCEAREGQIGTPTALLDVPGDGCVCVPDEEEVDCADSYMMQCTGSCPDGEVCEYTSTSPNLAVAGTPGPGCECIPETEQVCEESEYPMCGGSCPDNMECVETMGETVTAQIGYCVCQPTEGYCEDSEYPMCGGLCQDGLECISSPNGVCYCGEPEERCEASAPYCGGYCPEGQSCVSIVTGQCACTYDNEQNCDDGKDNDNDGQIDCDDPDCEDDPDCMEEPDCEDSYDMQCTGVCDSGLRCAMTSSYECDCIPADTPSCSYMDTAYCEMGSCPSGESCRYTAGECSCVPDYEDICNDKMDNDNDGYIDCRDQDCANDPNCI